MGALPRRRGTRRARGLVTLKALLFDLDGTLIDSDPIHATVFVEFLAARGVAVTEADYMARMHGRQNVDIFREILPEADPHEMDAAKEAEYRARLTPGMEPVAGARELLDRAATHGWRTGLVTNACRANMETVLSVLALEGRFETISLGEDCPQGKPHPEPYLRALDALGVAAHEAIAFEDSPSGITAAVAAGIPTVGIATGLAPERLIALGARIAIPNFHDPRLHDLIAQPQGAHP